jgi:signal transduction histidine kinase
MDSNLTAPSANSDQPLSPRAAGFRERDARLQALKALAGHLAHSFNNSLAPMAGYLTLLGEETKRGSTGEQYLTRLEASINKAEGLIDVLVRATHPEKTLLPRQTDLSALLQRMTEAWMKALPVSAQITLESDVRPCTLCLDETQWTEVIRQLLRNVQAALGNRGALRLTLRQATLTALEAVELGLSEQTVYELIFQDTGCGMSEEVLRRACEPLFTTRQQSPMAGLGLTLVHSVVLLHCGQIEIESTEGEGTTVRIWLPANGN